MLHDSQEVERSVLGCILLWPEDLQDKLTMLDESDFSSDPLQELYRAMAKQYKASGRLDFVMLSSEINPQIKPVLVECMETAVTRHRFDEHLSRLKELSQKRRLRGRIGELLYDDFGVSELQKIIDDEHHNRNYLDSAEKTRKNIDGFISGLGKRKPRIMTGLHTVDRVTGGIRKGCVFYLGARPSTGKTSLALNIAANQRKYGQKVLIFSLEMSAEMIFERLVSSERYIAYSKFSTQTLSDEEQRTIVSYMEQLRDEGMVYVVDDVYTAEGICNTICELKPDLAIVDYMQIVTTSNTFENVRTKVDYISSEFKRTAKNAGCALMVLSQLSRNGKEAPTMSDLKESGGLEADGDYIALLHRPFVLRKDDPDINPEDTELLLDKNKFGRTGKVELRFNLKYQRFAELDVEHEEPGNVDEYEELL